MRLQVIFSRVDISRPWFDIPDAGTCGRRLNYFYGVAYISVNSNCNIMSVNSWLPSSGAPSAEGHLSPVGVPGEEGTHGDPGARGWEQHHLLRPPLQRRTQGSQTAHAHPAWVPAWPLPRLSWNHPWCDVGCRPLFYAPVTQLLLLLLRHCGPCIVSFACIKPFVTIQKVLVILKCRWIWLPYPFCPLNGLPTECESRT